MEITDLAMIVTGIAIALIIFKLFANPIQSQILNKKFVKIGVLTGKTFSEICSIVGTPNISESLSDGTAHTWSSAKYAIKLKFDKNNICIGKLGEVSKK